MTQATLLAKMARLLESAGAPFMVVGSFSSSIHGQPRTTNDLDLVVDFDSSSLSKFVSLLGDGFYVSPEAAHDALARRGMFNVIDFESGWKIDLIVLKNRLFSRSEFGRRRPAVIDGLEVPVATPEDVILSKLEWNLITPSRRQVEDARQVALNHAGRLDLPYLRDWAEKLGISEALESVISKAETNS